MADNQHFEYCIVVLGGGGVGKSALTIRLITDNFFLDEYDPTIVDSYRKQVMVDDETALLEILDTAGQEEFATMQDQWIRDGKGFLLVYNITERNTLEEIPSLYDKILRAKDQERVPIVLIGNKSDLVDDREVATSEGEELAAQWRCPFFETSAKMKINNEECFLQVVREIRKMEKKPQQGSINRKKVCTIL